MHAIVSFNIGKVFRLDLESNTSILIMTGSIASSLLSISVIVVLVIKPRISCISGKRANQNIIIIAVFQQCM